ncbi:MAG TPA: ATP-binding cassette domain-containing protein [Microbacteriaceae bacterium]|nr:ATP-binding cassette domain-containing protein [Microbacteriaceae bacterium]
MTQAIEVDRLTKRYREVLAVDDLSFTVRPGRVTGFLGPNGAGKTTTLRIILGLVGASSGRANIGGQRYRSLVRPLSEVGASLEATSFHPGRTARDHLRVQATGGGVSRGRVGVVLEQVGLAGAADRRVGGYSLGMRQRLGLASALLGDPGVLVLDEPINGLDPEGIRWVRSLLRVLAAEGRTVLISSHVLSEVEQVVDDLVVIDRGRSVYQGPIGGLVASRPRVVVDAEPRAALAAALASHVVGETDDGALLVEGIDAAEAGRIAFAAGIALTHLAAETQGLEGGFLELIRGAES